MCGVPEIDRKRQKPTSFCVMITHPEDTSFQTLCKHEIRSIVIEIETSKQAAKTRKIKRVIIADQDRFAFSIVPKWKVWLKFLLLLY